MNSHMIASALLDMSKDKDSQLIVARNTTSLTALVTFLDAADAKVARVAAEALAHLAGHPGNKSVLRAYPGFLAALNNVKHEDAIKYAQIALNHLKTSVAKPVRSVRPATVPSTHLPRARPTVSRALGGGVGLASLKSSTHTAGGALLRVQPVHQVALHCGDLRTEAQCEAVRSELVKIPGVLSVTASLDTRRIGVYLRTNVPLTKLSAAITSMKLTPGPFVVAEKQQAVKRSAVDSSNKENVLNANTTQARKRKGPSYLDDESTAIDEKSAVTLFDETTVAGRLARQRFHERKKQPSMISRLGRLLW